MLSLCERINAPIKPSKVEGPSTSLTFLGIHLNTTTMEASITSDRKQALLSELLQLRYQRKCTKRALLSLIGKLSFCCKVLPAGRIFLRRLIDLSTTVKNSITISHYLPTLSLIFNGGLISSHNGQEKVSSFKPAGFPILQCSFIQMLPEPKGGVPIGPVGGCKVTGLRGNAQ